MKTTTSIATPNASRYLQQLCKHFGHKIETRFDPHDGLCIFPNNQVTLKADAGALDVTITAEDEAGLLRGQDVIWSHLARFAFREDLATPEWVTG